MSILGVALRSCRLALLTVALAVAADGARRDDDIVSLGTGDRRGLYYPVGAAICDFANQEFYRTSVRCSVEATVGSVYNVDALQSGRARSRDPAGGCGAGSLYRRREMDRPTRSANCDPSLALYPEVMTIIARKDAGIASVDDLGQARHIGSRGSGARATWELLEQSLGWQRSKLDKCRRAATRARPIGSCARGSWTRASRWSAIRRTGSPSR